MHNKNMNTYSKHLYAPTRPIQLSRVSHIHLISPVQCSMYTQVRHCPSRLRTHSLP